MTRRIALAILLTVWAMLIAGGLVSYITTRSILLADLDSTLMGRALSRAMQLHTSPNGASLVILGADRYRTQNDLKQTLARPATNAARYEPQILSTKFSSGAEHRLRTATIRYFAAGPDDKSEPRAFITTISQSAEEFDALLNRLALTLVAFGIVAGLLTAGVAVRVSKTALLPLASTADQIGAIDERQLNRRIDASALPVELVPMADKLNAMLARLQDAFELRNRFLADASHELRTPVAALVTTLDVALTRPREAEAYRRVLESCRTDARQLRHLVERLMEQVRGQSLTHDEPATLVDISRLIDQCADNVLPLAEVRNVTLIRAFADGMEYQLPPGRFRGVVRNLLGTAIEYNRPGGHVEIHCACDADGLKLRIKDNGPGISEEHLPHIFEPFYRADPSRKQEAGHLGLGLSLVQSHVRAMSGECRVESVVGVGTTFFVELPQIVQTARQASISSDNGIDSRVLTPEKGFRAALEVEKHGNC